MILLLLCSCSTTTALHTGHCAALSVVRVGLDGVVATASDAHDHRPSDAHWQLGGVVLALFHTAQNGLGKTGLVGDLLGEELVVHSTGVDCLFDVVAEPQLTQCSVRHRGENLWSTAGANHQANPCTKLCVLDDI